MSSRRAQRSALLSLSLCVLAATSCRTSNDSATTETPPPEVVVSTTPPFQTKEPQRYSATRTITIFKPNGETVVTRILIARDGPMRREESDSLVYLETPEGRFVLRPGEKVYAAVTADDKEATETAEADEISPDRLLHADSTNTSYHSMGSETVDGRNAMKYRIVVNSPAPGNVSLNETLMWIDQTLNMPIKSETKSPDGTRATMELSAITLDPDPRLFQVPSDYEKIAFSALRKQLNERRLNP